MMVSKRISEPAHYVLKIESFSLLSEAETSLIQSDVFEACGYKWRLDLHPNGNEEENVDDDYISLYVVICDDTESLPKGWEVCADVNFYVYDHLTHTYATFQGVDGNRIRFHEKRMKWGFDKLISLECFKETKTGYLCSSNDSCVFGVEVFTVPAYYTQKDRCLSFIKPPPTRNTYTWTIEKLSAVTNMQLYSEIFKVGKVKWKLLLYPEGCGSGKGTHLSIFLCVHDTASLTAGWRFYTKFKIQVKNQLRSRDHDKGVLDHWFNNESDSIGSQTFMLLTELRDPAKGFLLNDSLIIGAEISIVGTFRDFF